MATEPSTSRKGAKEGDAALDRLSGSIDAAQAALKDLRRDLSKGGRDVLKDLDVLLRDARRNLRGAQRTLIKDLEEMQEAATGKRPRTTAARAPARRTTATKRTTTTTSASRKTTGQRTRPAHKT